ncbi:MAG TPA: alkaline phosphatase family protein [Nevskiaceae bacterium]|nr:alkaline phosphatase family protein [Nevskiaceae bacterium]
MNISSVVRPWAAGLGVVCAIGFSGNSVAATKRATSISAHPEILEITPTHVHLRMKANLNATNPTQPLAGRTVSFSAPKGVPLCAAVTDATGTAACGNVLTFLRTTLNLGYVASFAGDAADLPSSVSGGLIGNAVTATSAPPSATIGHVFVVILENESYASSFQPPSPTYLSSTLPAQGALLTSYYGIGHVSNDNYIAMVSGQGPNALTQSDCIAFVNFVGSGPIAALDNQAVGQGCVYPANVPNVTDQLRAKGLTWKAYMEDMGNTPSRESATCGHPALNSQDGTQSATAQDSYATRHNPFAYFHSIIDDAAYCNQHVVNLSPLQSDLASIATTPNFVFISPSLCHDGHDAPCANGEPGGLTSINTFLPGLVHTIVSSPAFQQDGLLIVTFDEGAVTDASACCGETAGPNSPLPGITGLGGGLTGAVLLSPFITPGTVSSTAYNHYSMLRSIEDLLGLRYLGYAGASAQASFGPDVFTAAMPQFPPKN